MSLKDFLEKEINSVTREKILYSKLIYDLKIAAASRNYDLRTYLPDIDRDGYDIVLDDSTINRTFQIKSISSTSKTDKWDIHQYILRPNKYTIDRLPHIRFRTGLQGGVILIEYKASDDKIVNINYYYTDIFIITALYKRIIKNRPTLREKTALRIFHDITSGKSTDKIKLRKSTFLLSKSPSSLLALMGLHSNDENSWINHLLNISEDDFKVAPEEMLRKLVADELSKLANLNP